MITAKEAAKTVKDLKDKKSLEHKLKMDKEFRRKSDFFDAGFKTGKDFIRVCFDDTVKRAAEQGRSSTTITIGEHTENNGAGLAYIEGILEAILTAAKASGFDAVGKVVTKSHDNVIYADIGVGW